MKVLLVCAAVLGVVMSEAPAPPQGWRPSGRFLLLPARLENPPPAEYKPSSNNTTQKPESDEKEPARILDQGEYYVLLEGGRLQMVKYTTSPLKQEDKPSSAPSSSQQTQKVRQPEPFAQFQVEYLQFPQAQPQPQGPQAAQTKVENKAEVEGYEANVQYRDVKPISAPIYAYNSAPLVRILKK